MSVNESFNPYQTSLERLIQNHVEKFRKDGEVVPEKDVMEIARQVIMEFSFFTLLEWVEFGPERTSEGLFVVTPKDELGKTVCDVLVAFSSPGLVADPEKVRDVRKAIWDILSTTKGVTFAELSLKVPWFNGEKEMVMGGSNTVVWTGMSDDAIQAMNELITERKVGFALAPVREYLDRGKIPQAKTVDRPIESQEVTWWPVFVVKMDS